MAIKSQEIIRAGGLPCARILMGSLLLAAVASVQNMPVTGAMLGVIFGEDMKTPAESAVVKIRNMKDGSALTSAPTEKDGMFNLNGIGEGRYILGVSTGEGDFNFGYSVIVKGQETAKLFLALKPRAEGIAGERFGGLKPTPDIGDLDGFFRDPEGDAVVVADDSTAILNCLRPHHPPKCPISPHHPR